LRLIPGTSPETQEKAPHSPPRTGANPTPHSGLT